MDNWLDVKCPNCSKDAVTVKSFSFKKNRKTGFKEQFAKMICHRCKNEFELKK